MSEDMSDIIGKLNSMLQNNELPDNIKNVLNSFTNNSNTTSTSSNSTDSQNCNNSEGDNKDFSNIDLNTLLKIKSIIEAINSPKDDPRANLLRSLKPYLKSSRKDKVEQYIKLFNLGKVFENLNSSGGENKNDL